jgi:hypothetical protein
MSKHIILTGFHFNQKTSQLTITGKIRDKKIDHPCEFEIYDQRHIDRCSNFRNRFYMDEEQRQAVNDFLMNEQEMHRIKITLSELRAGDWMQCNVKHLFLGSARTYIKMNKKTYPLYSIGNRYEY